MGINRFSTNMPISNREILVRFNGGAGSTIFRVYGSKICGIVYHYDNW